eukprot:281874-Rhodomonas_salina.1
MRLHLHRLRRSSGTKSPDLCTLADTDLGHFAARGLKFGTRWEETLRLVSSPTLALCDVRARYSQNVCFDNSAERGPDSEEAVQVHSGPVSRESGPGVCEAHHVPRHGTVTCPKSHLDALRLHTPPVVAFRFEVQSIHAIAAALRRRQPLSMQPLNSS